MWCRGSRCVAQDVECIENPGPLPDSALTDHGDVENETLSCFRLMRPALYHQTIDNARKNARHIVTASQLHGILSSSSAGTNSPWQAGLPWQESLELFGIWGCPGSTPPAWTGYASFGVK